MSGAGDGGGGSRAQWETASAIVARDVPVTGSHILRIVGYSRTKGIGNGRCLVSETFAVGGHRWHIKYYPDGSQQYNSWISIAVSLDQHNDLNEVSARHKISLLDQDGEPVPLYTQDSSACYTFSSKNTPWSCPQLITRKDLEESAYLKDDVFSIRYDVTVPKEIFTEPVALYVVAPPSDMHRHFGRLLSGGEGADITFKVGGETFAAHRCVLAARSSIFMAELLGPMKEKTATCVRIDDMEARVFKAMLHFIYTDELPEIEDNDAVAMAQHLLVAADRYNLERLKQVCAEKLCGHMDTTTAATTLALPQQHGCRGLKEVCFRFLASAGSILKAVMASDGFDHLRTSCPSVLKELVAKLAP